MLQTNRSLALLQALLVRRRKRAAAVCGVTANNNQLLKVCKLQSQPHDVRSGDRNSQPQATRNNTYVTASVWTNNAMQKCRPDIHKSEACASAWQARASQMYYRKVLLAVTSSLG